MATKLIPTIVFSIATPKNTVVTSTVQQLDAKEAKNTGTLYIAEVNHVYDTGKDAKARYFVISNSIKNNKGLSSNVIDIPTISETNVQNMVNAIINNTTFSGNGSPDTQNIDAKAGDTYHNNTNGKEYIKTENGDWKEIAKNTEATCSGTTPPESAPEAVSAQVGETYKDENTGKEYIKIGDNTWKEIGDDSVTKTITALQAKLAELEQQIKEKIDKVQEDVDHNTEQDADTSDVIIFD